MHFINNPPIEKYTYTGYFFTDVQQFWTLPMLCIFLQNYDRRIPNGIQYVATAAYTNVVLV